ncbi:MAG: hypothetical protein WC370_04075 [Dehalococcoidales bacterium]|jgi:hypothetical protein
MIKNPHKSTDGSPEPEEIQPAIMTKPLPVILDELENYIRRVEDAVKLAQAAARDSREAADQARESGERAAEAAKKAAEAAVAKVREESARKADALNDRINEVVENLSSLEDKVKQEVIALDDAFEALKVRHVEQSPFFK